jgi:hypothetical protein
LDLQDSIGLAFFTIILTLLTNILFKWLQNRFDFFVETKKFKRDRSYNQLKELYIEAYAIIAQSEFLRVFHSIDEFRSIEEVPFLEIQRKLKRYKNNLFTGDILEESEEIVESAISKFNKIGLAQLILDKKQFASQDLLKLAVAYRYVHEHYLNNELVNEQLEKFQTKELELIFKLVTMVIKETNIMMKLCKMEYNNTELKNGKMDNSIFEAVK